MPRVITLDGPSGAGKSTLGAALAKVLGWAFFDSGLAYRGVARIAIERQVAVSDVQTLSLLATELKLEVDRGTLKVGELEPGNLQARTTAEFASRIATRPELRRVLTTRIQRLIEGHSCVVAGRDAGSAIFPQAPLRVSSAHHSTYERCAEQPRVLMGFPKRQSPSSVAINKIGRAVPPRFSPRQVLSFSTPPARLRARPLRPCTTSHRSVSWPLAPLVRAMRFYGP